jgi:hypothetical protein
MKPASLQEMESLRFRFRMNHRLRLESLSALSKVFREFGEPISDDLLSSLVFALPQELTGFGNGSARHAASPGLPPDKPVKPGLPPDAPVKPGLPPDAPVKQPGLPPVAPGLPPVAPGLPPAKPGLPPDAPAESLSPPGSAYSADFPGPGA